MISVVIKLIMLSVVMLNVVTPQRQYSQHFIFFVTYELAQYTRLGLLDPFVSYEENKVL
jgi:hypothetical protein